MRVSETNAALSALLMLGVPGDIMLAKTRFRRPLAILLVIAGAMMMFLALETWAGVLLLVLGITIEVLGITIKHRDEP